MLLKCAGCIKFCDCIRRCGWTVRPTRTQHVSLAMESGPASKAVHECLIEKASLEAISVGAFVELRGLATATMGQADDSALGKLEAR